MALSPQSLTRPDAASLALLAALGILLIGLPVPTPIRALLEIGILGAAVAMTVLKLRSGEPMQLARIAFLAMMALYVALLAHSNLPSVTVGLQGIRYTMVSIAGLMLGLTLPDGGRIRLIPAITLLLLASAALSLAVHLFFPGVESSFDRTADVSTSMLGGETRMQGLLSGPFHVAILGTFLTLAGAWTLALRRPIGALMITIGGAVLLLAKVRTGIITVALGLVVLIALAVHLRRTRPELFGWVHLGSWRSALVALLAVAVVGITIGAVAGDNVAVKQIKGLPTDHRVASRVDAIEDALDVSLDSPLTGWGPGASASGLKHDFWDADKVQINPHSGALGLTVEAGVGALICFLLIGGQAALALLRQLRRGAQAEAAGLAVAAALPIAAFWLIGDGLAALPITLALSLIVGVFLADGFALDEDGETG